MAGAAILRRGGRFPIGGIRLPRAASAGRLGARPSRSGPAAALMSRAVLECMRRARARGDSRADCPAPGAPKPSSRRRPFPRSWGAGARGSPPRARLAGGGRLRRLGPSRRDGRFANLRNSVSLLYEAREQNVFGGTESGYTALCGDKNESTAMTNTLDAPCVRRYCAGRPRRAAAPDGIARDCVQVASTRVRAGSSETPSPMTLRARPEKTIGDSQMAPHLLENTRNRVGNGRPHAELDPMRFTQVHLVRRLLLYEVGKVARRAGWGAESRYDPGVGSR